MQEGWEDGRERPEGVDGAETLYHPPSEEAGESNTAEETWAGGESETEIGESGENEERTPGEEASKGDAVEESGTAGEREEPGGSGESTIGKGGESEDSEGPRTPRLRRLPRINRWVPSFGRIRGQRVEDRRVDEGAAPGVGEWAASWGNVGAGRRHVHSGRRTHIGRRRSGYGSE